MQTSGINNNKRQVNLDTKKLVQFLILPCKQLGLIGCFISPFYIVIILPIVIIRFILPYIPIFKVSWTLLCSIVQTYRKMYREKLETRTCMKEVEFFFSVSLFSDSFHGCWIVNGYLLRGGNFLSTDRYVFLDRYNIKCINCFNICYLCGNAFVLCL